jgi:nitrate reductase assembly molybdenum cofactor insertion protein NarJ
MQKYQSKEVVCPFYHKEEATKILCEGFCKSCSLQTSFAKNEQLLAHKARYCNTFKGYPQCPLYPVINKQYEET